MITLCMDTSHRYLTLVLIEDNKIKASFQQECHKRQSENILMELDKLCAQAGIGNEAIDEICVTRGPGSYTGVRIAMTIAKIMCSARHLPLYTCSTLKLFSGGVQDCAVVLDARSHRAYYAIYQNGDLVQPEAVAELDVIQSELPEGIEILGDRTLFGLEDQEINYCEAFLNNRKEWRLEANVHTCVPEYLKENNEYLVQK